MAFQYLKEHYKQKGNQLLTWSDNGEGGRVTERVVRCWNRLPGEPVDAPFMEVFKTGMDGALGNLI